MHKQLRIVLVFLLSLCLFGCLSVMKNLPIKTPSIQLPTTIGTASCQTFTDQNSGYSMCLPNGWTSKIVNNQYLMASGDNGQSDVIIWPIVLGGQYKSINALQLTNFVAGTVKHQYPDFTVLNLTANKDNTIVQIVATYYVNGTRYEGVLTTFLDKSGSGFMAGYETDQADFSQRENGLRQILASYKMMQPAGAAQTSSGQLAAYQSPGGEFTMQIPSGWQVSTAGSCANLAVAAIDPQNPVRQVIAFTEIGPVYYDPAAKQREDDYIATCKAYGTQCPGEGTLDVLPLVANVNSETFITQAMPALGTLDLVMQMAPWYPKMSNFQITDRKPLPAALANLYAQSGLQYDGGIFTATFTQNGVSAKGMFLDVVTYAPTVGFATGGPLYMVSAPADEFDALEPTLVKSIESLKIGDAYLQNCQAQQRAQGQAEQQLSKTLSDTTDIITQGWEQRQQVNDELSEKWSDTILGRDRVYNPDNGNVYSVPNDFYDYYDTHREQYDYNNMQPLTPEQYLQVPLDGELHVH